jgi:hypothetical protein
MWRMRGAGLRRLLGPAAPRTAPLTVMSIALPGEGVEGQSGWGSGVECRVGLRGCRGWVVSLGCRRGLRLPHLVRSWCAAKWEFTKASVVSLGTA